MKTKRIDTLKEVLNSLKIQQSILKDLKENSMVLCEASNINLECYNELKEAGTTSYPIYIGEQELMSRYTFFGTMLGLIDSKLDSLKSDLKLRNPDIEKEYIRLLELRKEVLTDIKVLKQNFKQVYQEDDYLSYNKLNVDIILEDANFREKEELIKIYNTAYKNAEKINIDNIYYNYRMFCDEVILTSNINESKKKKKVL